MRLRTVPALCAGCEGDQNCLPPPVPHRFHTQMHCPAAEPKAPYHPEPAGQNIGTRGHLTLPVTLTAAAGTRSFHAHQLFVAPGALRSLGQSLRQAAARKETLHVRVTPFKLRQAEDGSWLNLPGGCPGMLRSACRVGEATSKGKVGTSWPPEVLPRVHPPKGKGAVAWCRAIPNTTALVCLAAGRPGSISCL